MWQPLTREQRLKILQAADEYRRWTSLDDRRQCVVCGRAFTGNDVEIRRDYRDRFLLHCPGENCASSMRHWISPDAILGKDGSSEQQEKQLGFFAFVDLP